MYCYRINNLLETSSESSCGAGFYSETGASECTKCAAGTYSRAGATECIQCAKGSYSGVGASRCSWCARGFYSGFGASECTKCPGDSTCTPGSTKQADCIELTGFINISKKYINTPIKGKYISSEVYDILIYSLNS